MEPDSRPLFMRDGSPVHSDPEIRGGEVVFVGTRVPAKTLVDYATSGLGLEEFLDNFPSVRREQAVAYMERNGIAFAAHPK